MNIFKFELKRQLTGVIIWTIAILAVLWGLMVGVFPTFQDSVADVTKVMEGFPPQFAAAFGINVSNLFTFGGYYNFCFGYIGVMGAIMAASIGISVFSRESRSKCSDFLLTKPISRPGIFCRKLLTGVCLLISVNILYLAAAAVIGAKNDTDMWLAGLSLLLTQLVFFALGLFYAVFSKKVRSVSGAATAFGFGAFILSALVNILDEESLRLIAPLKYFEPLKVFSGEGYDPKYALTGAAVILICIFSAYLRFTKSDAKSI